MSKPGEDNAPPAGSTRKLTVLQVLPELESGGVERGTLELARHLAQNGHNSLVVSGGGRMVAKLEAEGSQHIAMSLGKKNPLTLTWLIPLRRLLISRQVDIIHSRSRVPAWIAYLAWKSLPLRKRPRFVTTFHGFYSVNSYSAIMTKGEKVIAVSKAIADHIQKCYQISPQRIVTIPRGVDTDSFDPAQITEERLNTLKSEWNLSVSLPVATSTNRYDNKTNLPLIMLPGRISRLKGHDVFLKALAQILDLPWQAVCVGDPKENPGYATELLNLAQSLQIDHRVKFVGHCSDMPSALMLADLVVSTTYTHPEAFGRIAVEAAAMGKAMIASAHGGSLETVIPGKTGWLVAPGDHIALANALREALLDDKTRERFGQAGRKMALDNFTTTKTCERTISLYKELI